MAGDRDIAPGADTITLGQYQRRENASANGTDAVATNGDATCLCAVCSKPLSARQKRTCSVQCSRRLAGVAKSRPLTRRAATASAVSLDLATFLRSVPVEVDALEIGGWRCERIR